MTIKSREIKSFTEKGKKPQKRQKP